jgi:hypothetical protein
MPDHVADHGRLFPARDENGDTALGTQARRRPVAPLPNEPVPNANDCRDKVFRAAEEEKSGESAHEEGPNRYGAAEMHQCC